MSRGIQEFDFSVNVLEALLWQFNEADALITLLQKKQDWYDQNHKKFWEDWIRDVFDLRTANEFGLSVWSIILDLPLIVTLAPAPPTQPTFGFGGYNQNFTRGNFRLQNGGVQVLTPEQARIALRMRYFQMVSRGTIYEINKFMTYLFGRRGALKVVDGLNPMTIVYIFGFAPSSQLQFVLEKYDVLPRPAGVSATYEVVVTEAWGFGDPHENFDNGNFASSI